MRVGTVVTTIQHPTPALLEIASHLESTEEPLYIVGDKKSPPNFAIRFGQYFSAQAQEGLPWTTVKKLPWNSYSRKMLGYLIAVNEGCTYIRETDDDNRPLSAFFYLPTEINHVRIPDSSELWINPYSYFSNTDIWPRGLPLEKVLAKPQEFSLGTISSKNVGVYQGLANGSPDVDAIYRLTRSDVSDFQFDDLLPLLIPRDCYTPFNSQATFWNVELLPLMYLPATCSFRMTDIWRSFIALRVMRETSFSLVFTSATMYQDRNEHNLLKDFESEVAGYLGNDKIIEALNQLHLEPSDNDLAANLRVIYLRLVELGFFAVLELEILEDWLMDCASLLSKKVDNE